MNDNLLQISLKQGKHFKKKFSKIKEGFVSLEKQQEHIIRPSYKGYVPVLQNMKQDTNLTKNMNQSDLNEVKQAQQKYNDLIQQYTAMQQKIGNSSLNTVNRLASNNPYLNKTVRFNNGPWCYVTKQGVAGWIHGFDILYSTNAPTEPIDINLPWLDSYNTPGTTIPTNPPLISGPPIQMGQSLGNEGSNVYASKLINNPSSKYIGCYNDKPASTLISIVPVMNSSNTNNGINTLAWSIYDGNKNGSFGPWAAFDGNPNTFWHSKDGMYNSTTGIYQGQDSTYINGVGSVRGDVLYLQSIPANTVVTQYSIAPRLGGWAPIRSPNSWYVIGLSTPPNMQWYVVDRQENQNFRSDDAKVYKIKNPKNGYIDYVLLVDKVGNDDTPNDRQSVQVAEWKLFTSSDYSMSDDKRGMIWNPSSIGYTTYDKCQEYAVENGYKYFGLQDVQPDGTAACLVSNDGTKSIMYGDASVQRTAIPLWSSNTSSDYPCTAQLSGGGDVSISDSTKQLGGFGGSKGCESWGTMTVQSATYGGNCKAPIGNVTDKVAKMGCNWVDSCSIPISVSTFGDPVPGCVKNFDLAYSCGSTPFSKHLEGEANGQTMIMDECKAYMANNCQFFLILQDDGDMCIYKGTDPSNNKGLVWSSNTKGQQKAPNPDWVASKGVVNRPYLTTGQWLTTGKWIGSTDGSLKLIMETTGNLVLYTSEVKSGCKVINDKTYGGGWINAIYELNNAGNKNTLGKVGYIDSESKLMLYPDSMLETTNNYQIFTNSDSGGNDINFLNVKDQNECQTACNNNADCRAYQFNGNNCWLKNKNAYPKSGKYSATGATLGVRLPGVKGSKTCSNKIVNVDTVQFDNYIFGAEMTPNTQCNSSVVSHEDQIAFDNIKSQLIMLGDEIASKTENLYNQDNKIFEKLNMNEDQFKKSIENYKLTNIKIKKELNLKDNNIEGMQNNNDNDNNMYNINGILTDSDLRVLQENYSYIMWSIFAIGTLTITINTLKK